MLKTGRRGRDDIDVVSVSIWSAYIKRKLSQSSLYQIEKVIEPAAFGKNQYGHVIHRNKWPRYRAGKHTPNQALIDAAELHAKGSANMINSVIWEAIRGRKELDWFVSEGIGQLSWEVKKVLYKSNKYQLSSELVLAVGQKELLRLERLAGLDALAAQIVLLRVADHKNERERALAIGKSIYRTFLIMCTAIPYLDFSPVLMSLFDSYVLPLAHDGSKRVHFESENSFLNKVKGLNDVFLTLEDKDLVRVGRKNVVRVLSDVLHAKYGFELMFEFAIPVSILEKS